MTATPQLASSNSSFSRSSHLELFCKKCVLRNFAKFTGKHLCQSLFFNKIVGLACNLIKKETLAQVFSCEFCEVSKNTFPYRTPQVAASVTGLKLSKWKQPFQKFCACCRTFGTYSSIFSVW